MACSRGLSPWFCCALLLASALPFNLFVSAVEDSGSLQPAHLEMQDEVDFTQPDVDPPWVEEYINFHAKTRGQPGAKYLISVCSANHNCGGLGDRLRGILFALMLANHHNRVLLIQWDSPGPLEEFLVPARINWTLSSDLGIDMTLDSQRQDVGWVDSPDSVTSELRVHPEVHPEEEEGGKDKEGGKDEDQGKDQDMNSKLITWMLSTTHFNGRHGMPLDMPPFERVSYTSHLLMKALFVPSPELDRQTNELHKSLFGSLDRKYVAVHLRMAHLDGEMQTQNRFGGHSNLLHGFLAAVSCGTRFAKPLLAADAAQAAQDDPSKTCTQVKPRILLLTDHLELRQMVADRMMSNIVGPNNTAHHIGDANKATTTTQDHMTTFIDLLLMARASCLVWADSGFPKSAIMWAWHECSCEIPFCLSEMFETDGGGAPRGRIPRSVQGKVPILDTKANTHADIVPSKKGNAHTNLIPFKKGSTHRHADIVPAKKGNAKSSR